jgi:hypothetical protein
MISHFIGLIEPERYQSLRAIPSNQFPSSFEAFCSSQDRLTQSYLEKGARVIQVKVDVQEFADHCRAYRKPPNALTLNNFAFALASRRNDR